MDYKRLLKPINIIILSVVVGVLGFANFVSATTKFAGPLEVSYDGETIFAETNLAPGATVEKTLTVKNNGFVNHSFAIATSNVSGDLADSIMLSPVVDGNIVWTKTINELSQLPEQSLTVLDSINPAEIVQVALKAEFLAGTGNDYQGKDLNFDIIFGTQEVEPASNSGSGGDLSIASLGRGAVTGLTTTTSESPNEEDKVTDKERTGGTGDEPDKTPFGKNKWLLMIVPGVALIALTALSSTWQRNIGLPLVAGSSAYLLSNYVHGDMATKTFWIFLGTETVGAGLLKLFIKDHHKNHIKRLHQKYFVRKIG